MTDSSQPSPAAAPPPNAWGPLWPLGEAIRFLTLLPTPGMPPPSLESIGRAVAFFPLVGALIGGMLALVGLAADTLWEAPVRALLIVIAWGVVTAGLHLDGLSDTFDGVMSWRSRERKLEIMRDSRIGVMGALALLAVFGLKAALLASANGWLVAALLTPVLGRWAGVYGIVAFPPAREGGLGRTFQSHMGRRDIFIATATALLLAGVLAGLRGLLALAIVWAVAWLLARWWVRDLGGLTGDTYGALCEIAEVVALAVLLARLP